MRFGSCTTEPAEVLRLQQCGYALFEANFQQVCAMSDEEMEKLFCAVRDSGVTLAGMNCFAPPTTCLLRWSDEEANRYFAEGVRRAKPLGLEYVVIGSGGARKIPEGMSREAGMARLVTLLRHFGEIAAAYDVEIYVEPLCRKETNVINTVLEAVELCRRVNHPRVGCMADFYHMHRMGEPFTDVRNTDGYLRHVHVATADRRIPLHSDADEVKTIAKALKEAGYHGRVVLEGAAKPDAETALSDFSEWFSCFE